MTKGKFSLMIRPKRNKRKQTIRMASGKMLSQGCRQINLLPDVAGSAGNQADYATHFQEEP